MRRRNVARRTRVRAWPALSAVWWAGRCGTPYRRAPGPPTTTRPGPSRTPRTPAAVRRHHYAVHGQPVGPEHRMDHHRAGTRSRPRSPGAAGAEPGVCLVPRRTAGEQHDPVNRRGGGVRVPARARALRCQPVRGWLVVMAEFLAAGAVARRLNVAVTTLRSWHQRYGLGPSGHEAGTHRRYTPEDLGRLEVMCTLVANGVPPGEAARYASRAPDMLSTDANPVARTRRRRPAWTTWRLPTPTLRSARWPTPPCSSTWTACGPRSPR